MTYWVYIAYSKMIDKYYVGQTENVDKRLLVHRVRKNLGANDWELKYKEEFLSRSQAMKRELEIKKKKSRKYIEWLIQSNNS
jgi:putative endonuclease